MIVAINVRWSEGEELNKPLDLQAKLCLDELLYWKRKLSIIFIIVVNFVKIMVNLCLTEVWMGLWIYQITRNVSAQCFTFSQVEMQTDTDFPHKLRMKLIILTLLLTVICTRFIKDKSFKLLTGFFNTISINTSNQHRDTGDSFIFY